MMHVHNLNGCAPSPLAHYLKALGILRLVSEQADPEARGWWEGDRFRLATSLSRQRLAEFFLEEYEPTALVSPWNKGSGFFYDNDRGLTPLAGSTAPRFHRMRVGIDAARALIERLIDADREIRSIKNEAKRAKRSRVERDRLRNSADYKRRLTEAERRFKDLKADVIPQCRLTWRGAHREWLDAAVVLGDSGEPRFPALLGTGGNDGRLDFTNNFMQRLGDVFDLCDAAGRPKPGSDGRIAAALWQEVTDGYDVSSSVGQFLPGGAGGANSSNGPEGGTLLNPFDYLLMMEGSILFAAGMTRRLSSRRHEASAPFVVKAQAAGYPSAGESDEGARGEQWMPLWNQPLTLIGLRKLLGEGRAQIGVRSVRTSVDLAQAVTRMGTARGISSFVRYGYIERNGQSNLAVPLGRFRVPDRSEPHLVCLDDLAPWLPRVRQEARAKTAPDRLKHAERRLGEALFEVTQHPREAQRWQALLLSLADVETVMVTGSGYKAGPIPPLRPEWVAAAHERADNVSAREVRLAVSLALQRWGGPADSRPVMPDTVRRHWLPLKPSGYGFATAESGADTRLQIRPDRVMAGRTGEDDAIAIILRRLIEGGQSGQRRLPLVAARYAAARCSDLAALMAGQVSANRTMALSRAFMALDPRRWRLHPARLSIQSGMEWPDDGWITIRLSLLPWALEDGRRIGADPAIVRRLSAGDAATAFTLAVRRLGAAGLRTSVRMATSPASSKLWAAALAFPITRRTATSFVHRIDPSADKATEELQ
jgi:CRISPR-associated protein Csx17